MRDDGAVAGARGPTEASSRVGRDVIRLDGVGFAAGPTRILSNVTLMLPDGPPTALIGPNGSGKTTLLRVMMGLLAPSEGRVEIGEDVAGDTTRMAIMFQKPAMLRRSAAGNVAVALQAAGLEASRARILALLERVGLAPLAERPARLLSGGEQQRLALARALARKPRILFLDEPTASLDPAQSKIVEDIIADIARSGVKIVMATHHLGQTKRLCGDVVLLVQGRVAEHAPTAQLFSSPATREARRFLAGELLL